MAETKPEFVSGRLDFGLAGNVEIPSLSAGSDGRIHCVFSQNTQVIWSVTTRDGGRTWEKPSKVMDCPKPGYITDANAVVCPDPHGKGDAPLKDVKRCVPLSVRVTVFATYVDNSSKVWRSRFLAATTTDGGRTWSSPAALPIAHQYPVGKIHTPVWLDDRTVLMGYSWDQHADEGKSFGDEGGMRIKSGVLISTDAGRTWAPGKDVPDIAHAFGLDEPAIARLGNGDIFMILRTATPYPYETLSHDGGRTWDPPRPSAFCAYNSPSALLRLRDGAVLRAWDNSHINRFPLVVSVSTDDCKTWSPPRTIAEPTLDGVFAASAGRTAGLKAGRLAGLCGKNIAQGRANFERACYPSLAEAPDGTVLAVWWQRTVEGVNSLGYARFNRAWVEEAGHLPKPRMIVTFGDSVTAAIGRCGVHTCQTYSFLLDARLKTVGLSAQVINAGVGGNSTRDGLKRLERDVLSQKPDLVVAMFGVNDAAMVDGGPVARTEPRVPAPEYRANLTKIVKTIQASGAAVVLCTPTPMSRKYAYSNMGAYATHEDMNYMLVEYAAAAREVARETGATLVDTFSAFMGRPDGLKLIQDGCHPNVAGQALIAETLTPIIRQAMTGREANSTR